MLHSPCTVSISSAVARVSTATRRSCGIPGHCFAHPSYACIAYFNCNCIYLKNEIYAIVSWRVEILNETVAAEIAALPADMQARFLRLAERIAAAGLESLSEPHVKHLEGKLWELRLTGRDGIARVLYVTAVGRRLSWFAPS